MLFSPNTYALTLIAYLAIEVAYVFLSVFLKIRPLEEIPAAETDENWINFVIHSNIKIMKQKTFDQIDENPATWVHEINQYAIRRTLAYSL